MKKLYALLMMLCICIAASAQKTVTVVIDNPDAAYALSPSYTRLSWDANNSAEVTFSSGTIYVYSNSGYNLSSAVSSSGVTFDCYSASVALEYYKLNDGDTVYITTIELEPIELKISADPELVYVSYNNHEYTAADQVDGVWTFNFAAQSYNTVTINPKDDCKITSVKRNGEEMSFYTAYYSISTSSLSGLQEYVVEAVNLNESRDMSVLVNVVGTPSKIKFTRNGETSQTATLVEGENEIFYDSENEVPFTITNAVYNQYLYKVTNGNETIEPEGTRWTVYPSGEEITIYTDYPETPVPVKFNYLDGVSNDVISYLSVGGTGIDKSVWSADDFSVLLGKIVYITFNSSLYTINSVKVNGTTQTSTSYIQFTVTDEDGYEIEIDATKKATYICTLKCNDPEQIVVKLNYTQITLDGYETNLEMVEGSSNRLDISAASGYEIESVVSSLSGDVTSSRSSLYIYEAQTITVESSKFERPHTATVYLDESVSWTYNSFTLSPSSSDNRLALTLDPGYNFVDFALSDRPFSIGTYPNPVIYHNDEIIAKDSYSTNYPATENFVHGDVLKIYQTEVDFYTVTIETSGESVPEVEYQTDYIVNKGTNLNELKVLPGTVLEFWSNGDEIDVTVDGESYSEPVSFADELSDDDSSASSAKVYSVTVSKDTKIGIVKAAGAGIVGIEAVKTSNGDVYNLQGILVKSGASAEQIKALPAGLYIVDGKKIVVR